jgi:hypothetical protein
MSTSVEKAQARSAFRNSTNAVDLGHGDLDGQLPVRDRMADHGVGLLVRDMGGEFLQRLGHWVVSCLGGGLGPVAPI